MEQLSKGLQNKIIAANLGVLEHRQNSPASHHKKARGDEPHRSRRDLPPTAPWYFSTQQSACRFQEPLRDKKKRPTASAKDRFQWC
jgi:hypothetical protein